MSRIGALAWLAFAAVCVFWGTTANAIRVGVQHIPPVLLSGARFTLAGGILLPALLVLGRRLPRGPGQWRFVAVGGLGLACANASLNVGMTQVESGLGSVLVSSNALWIALIESAWPGGRPPRALAWAGLLLGFTGIAILMLGRGGSLHADPLHLALLLASALFWALALVWQHHQVGQGPDPLVAAALQMLLAGPPLILLSLGLGERLVLPIPTPSLLAFAWLVAFGSLVGYVAYQYLLGRVPVAMLGLVPLINPVVAVALGVWLLGEALSARFWVAAGLVLAGVLLVQQAEARAAK